MVVDGDGDLLLRTQVPFGRLDRGMPEQEFNLFEIPAGFPAELGAGSPEIMGPESLDPDLAGSLFDDRPEGPVAQGLADLLAAFPNGAEEPPFLDAGGGLPAVDGLLDP